MEQLIDQQILNVSWDAYLAADFAAAHHRHHHQLGIGERACIESIERTRFPMFDRLPAIPFCMVQRAREIAERKRRNWSDERRGAGVEAGKRK